MGKPRYSRKYPTYPEIPEIPPNTWNIRKYPKVKKIPGNTRSYISTLLPDPNPTRYPAFCPIPDPTRYWKTLPVGHWWYVQHSIWINVCGSRAGDTFWLSKLLTKSLLGSQGPCSACSSTTKATWISTCLCGCGWFHIDIGIGVCLD